MSDLAARLERIESTLAIQQLPIRYAMAVDGRDIDAWVDLFIEDVNCGRHGTGRDALRRFIAPTLTNFYRSVHLICGHRIDFTSADTASGAVYCRAEHEDAERWVNMAICYFDTYERRAGEWFFARRRERHWYASEDGIAPQGPTFSNWPGQDIPEASLPKAFPSWSTFWAEVDSDRIAAVTRFPVHGARSREAK